MGRKNNSKPSSPAFALSSSLPLFSGRPAGSRSFFPRHEKTLAFLLGVAIMWYLLSATYEPADHDSYYHIKMAALFPTTSGSQRRADYAFYLAPNCRDVRFFVEAKKPSVDIGNRENYFQLIRYG